MLLEFGLQLVVLLLTVLATSCDARSRSELSEDDLHDATELADCGEDINPSLCSSVQIPEECKKNSTVGQSCKFSCSQSGQLWWAASEGNLTEVNTAIAAGANPTCQKTITVDGYDFPNMTALHLAAWYNHPEVAVALLDDGVDVNLQTTDGKTPIYYASWNASIDVLKLLIEHNADVNIGASGSGRWTPIMLAAWRGKLSIAKALINANASLDVRGGWENDTALHSAVYFNNPDIALLLIKHNADVNLAASDGLTPLMWASRRGRLNVVKALMNANASLDVTGGFVNATALFYAVYHNNTDIALLLIKHSADVNIAAIDESTPLMWAAWYGHLSVAKALINANANLDATGGRDNETALHYAARYDRQDVALILLQSGADTRIPDGDGRTPAESAKHYEKYQLADIIESYLIITTTTMEDIVTSSLNTIDNYKP